MTTQQPMAEHDPLIRITDFEAVQGLGETVLLGNWFVFLRADWLQRSGLAQTLARAGVGEGTAQPTILFRGKEEIRLPGVVIEPRPLPRASLISVTCDKELYRSQHDTVRLLLAAPQQPEATLRLTLRMNGSAYADYPVTLDRYGLCLWSMQGLPEGQYEAALAVESAGRGQAPPLPLGPVCRFEVAEYRLVPLHAELAEQTLSGEVLRYALSVTAFGQPYQGAIEVELEQRGQRADKRERLTCNRAGQCRGAVKLSGKGPFSLNVFADERSATVALKGSEQERRETLVISELGEAREVSLMPLPQSNQCRGMYIARGGANNQPFLVQRVVGRVVEITPRVEAELLRVVVVNPITGSFEEKLFHAVEAEHPLHMHIPAPYGLVLLGALVQGKAWEGWCSVLHPSDIHLQCMAPKEARPGESIRVILKTNVPERTVPVHLVVKDQRLVAPSDPLVEFAACMKQNLSAWREASFTGNIERQLSSLQQAMWYRRGMQPGMARPMMAMSPMAAPLMPPQPFAAPPTGAPMAQTALASMAQTQSMLATGGNVRSVQEAAPALSAASGPTTVATVARLRVRFPEILYNNIVEVRGEASIDIPLGEGVTRYSIEGFALSPESMDWQRAETTLTATQPVFGELTVSPFVWRGDPVMGRLDVSAASGGAIVEVRHEGEVLPLIHDDGSAVAPGLPIPSGSVVRFPVHPGTITASVRDARKGGIDASERYVVEPGKLRHIARRLHLLLPGDELTLQEEHRLAIKPLPGLERPFQVFVEAAAAYPFGCIEQTSTKILSMFTGYFSNLENAEVASQYAAVIPAWYRRLQSMYLPGSGFCFYPPQEGGARAPDTHYAPQAVSRLLALWSIGSRHDAPTPTMLQEILIDIHSMATDAADYYKIEHPPRRIASCAGAYALMVYGAGPAEREQATAFVRSRLIERDGAVYVEASDRRSAQWLGVAVSRREETAYAAATLLLTGGRADLATAVAATNYLTGQLNEEGRLYSTVDTAACLALLLALRSSGVITGGQDGRVVLNGQELALGEALKYDGTVDSLRCEEGVLAAEITTEVIEDWSAFQSGLPVEAHLERHGRAQPRFKVGDDLDLVIRVPRYEAGLVAHVCLPDALARVVGGGQVKRFSLDFCERNELRVPLAAVGATTLPPMKDEHLAREVRRWLGISEQRPTDGQVQHWAIIVRNMFKEEQIGNPGLLAVQVDS